MAVAYRVAAFGRPLRGEPSRIEGRFHRADQFEPTQYACLHPLGPWAEFMRAHDLRTQEQVAMIRQRAWALQIDLEPLTRVSFETTEAFGVSPAQLVGDDYRPCQALADSLRAEGARGMIVPSAALPGTENVVLFGARASAPHLLEPVSLIDIPASMVADNARPIPALTDCTRYRRAGTHAELHAIKRGEEFRFVEPSTQINAA